MNFIDQERYNDKKGIYIITNLKNKYSYIGQTRQKFNKRYWHHSWKLRNNTHDNIYLQNAWNKYGEESFEFSILQTVDNNDNLNRLEIYYIKKLRKTNKCYNVQDGGQIAPSYERTEKHRKAIGDKNRINMLGKKHSEETKRKMSESRTGKHYNKSNYVLTDNIAFKIKSMLITLKKPSSIATELNIPYKLVNNILSGNTWKHVIVDGWDDFVDNRNISKRLTLEEQETIYDLYCTGKYTQQDLADMYNKTRTTIASTIKKIRENKNII